MNNCSINIHEFLMTVLTGRKLPVESILSDLHSDSAVPFFLEYTTASSASEF